MFGYEGYQSKRERINKLEKQVAATRKTIEGGLFGNGLEDTVQYLKDHIKAQENAHENLRKRMSVLEEIVRESGLITDFESDEVKIREDRTFDIYNGINVKQVPYQINKVKVI